MEKTQGKPFEPHIPVVHVVSTILKRKKSINENNGRRDRGRSGKRIDEALEHAGELREAAEAANEKLALRNSPCRFYVFEESGEIFLHLVFLDENGSIRGTRERKITHDSFTEWLNHLERGEGILFDANG